MRLVAVVKRCVTFGEPLVGAVFAFEHPVAGHNHIHLFSGVVVPRIIEVRRHIDYEKPYRRRHERRVVANDAVAREPVHEVVTDIGIFVGFAPMNRVACRANGILKCWILLRNQLFVLTKDIAARAVKWRNGLVDDIIWKRRKTPHLRISGVGVLRCTQQVLINGFLIHIVTIGQSSIAVC